MDSIIRDSFRLVFSALAPAALAAFAACGSQLDEPSESVSTVQNGLFKDSATQLWPGGWVPVCWTAASRANSDFAAFSVRARNVVEDQWGRVANINFVGWDACPANANGFIAINLDDVGGNSDAGGFGFFTGARTLRFGLDRHNDGVILHEFGHELGFRHEFARPDFPDHDGCTGENGTTGDNFGTQPDNDSIMAATYCNSHTALSHWDIIGVQRAYGRKQAGSIVGLGGRCLNVAGGTTDFSPFIAWPCVGAANDTFATSVAASLNLMFVETIQGVTRCMNVSGGTVTPNGSTPVISWDCIAGASNEEFSIAGVQLRAMGDMCVVATGTTDGAQLEVQPCNTVAVARERWDFRGHTLRLSNTNLCVSVPNAVNGLGVRPTLHSCSATSVRETFTFTQGEIHDGSKCFNVSGGLPVAGSPVGLWDGCGNGLDNEYFFARGTIGFGGQCVDMLGGASFDGAQIGMFPCIAGAANQAWDYHWN